MIDERDDRVFQRAAASLRAPGARDDDALAELLATLRHEVVEPATDRVRPSHLCVSRADENDGRSCRAVPCGSSPDSPRASRSRRDSGSGCLPGGGCAASRTGSRRKT